jgi:hypothetical protein
MRTLYTLRWLLLLLFVAPAAHAAVIARVLAPAGPHGVGSTLAVELRADLDDPVLGWGLDLAYDPSLLLLTGAPSIGPAWSGFPAPDGDGLAAIALGDGLSGANVLLATLSFQALGPGTAQLLLSASLADLTEGFALDPVGFADASFVGAEIVIVPEPATALLLLAGLLPLARYTNSTSRSDTTRR